MNNDNENNSKNVQITNLNSLGPSLSQAITTTSEVNKDNDVFKLKLKGFRIGHLNINSLIKHIDQLRLYLKDEPFDILSINETKLNDTVNDQEIDIQGYQVIRRDRNRNGGGVAIYVRSVVNIKQRNELVPNDLEAICIEVIKPKSKSFLVISWYRSPNQQLFNQSEQFEKFEEMLTKLENDEKEYIIAGDVNCDLLSSTDTPQISTIKNIINNYQLKQFINEPTRVGNSSTSLLDLILTNMPENITNSGVIHVGISDHSLIFACRKLGICKQPYKLIQSRHFGNYCCSDFQDDLLLLNSIADSEDPNIMWNCWKNVFQTIADKHAPLRLRKAKSTYSPWLTSSIKNAIHNRDFLKKKAIKNGSDELLKAYKLSRNRVNHLIKKSKIEFYEKCIEENKSNPKVMWKNINQLIGKRSKTTTINNLSVHDNVITGDHNIAETLNDYFSTIGPSLAQNLPKSSTHPIDFISPVGTRFSFSLVTLDEVEKLLLNLKSNKSCGLDKISSKLLKDAASVVAPSLVRIFNICISSGIFPDDWKIARVSPLFKAGERDKCGNYRPISVLSVISKSFEKLLCQQITTYLEENEILYTQQSGFRKGHSTMTSLLNRTNKWLYNMDRGLINGILFLDLCKAFDTVDHEILMQKLAAYGICDMSLKLFSSYLCNRKQMCKVNQTVSQARTLTCGVPQGSNLGPLLFLIYVNDLPHCLKYSSTGMFADDTNLTVEAKTSSELADMLNADLENVHNWLLANRLSLNLDKTEYMVVGTRHSLLRSESELSVKLNNNDIKRVSSSKTLGVIVDEKLKWHQQIDNVSKKVSKALGIIRRVKSFLPRKTLILLYNTVALPHFDYCSAVWGNCSKSLQEKLQKLQNRAARIITGDSYETSSDEVLGKLNWKPLSERREDRLVALVRKTMMGKMPSYLKDEFHLSNNSRYDLRSNLSMLKLQKPRTNALKRCFSYRGAELWNKLPSYLKNINIL